MAANIDVEYPDGRKERRTTLSMHAVLTRSLYLPIAIGVMLLGGIFGGLGVVLVYLGAKGDTHMKLFGQSIDTANVGVASIFIGALTVILVIRRLLKSADRIDNHPSA